MFAVVAAICVYYFIIVVPCRLLPQNHYYNLMTDAFESGSLSLLVKPSKELLALKDPYDPAQNGSYRLHDASLYKGSYYLYFGPVPAIVLFAPLDIIFHVRLDQSTAVAVFLCLGFISSTLLLWFLLNKIRPPVPFWMFITGITALGLSNAAPFLLMRPDVYEVAIACGYFLGMTGLYLVLSGIYGSRVGWSRITTGSLCCGLAFGARPSYVVFALLLPLAAVAIINEHKLRWMSREALFSALLLCLPFGICVLGLFTYNYARFGNPFEYGNHYQLAAIHPKDYPLFRPDLFFSRLNRYLFYRYNIDGTFPFFHLPRGTYFGEPEAGSILMTPVVCLGLGYPLLSWIRSHISFPRYSAIFLIMVSIVGVSMVLLLPIIANPVVRYQMDYLGFLLLPSLFAWCDLSQRELKLRSVSQAVRIVGFALIAYGCWVGVAFGWNDVSPRAIRHLYDANSLAARGDAAQAVEEYREAIRISPDFALAESTLAQVLATQGRGTEAASHFSSAMRQFIGTNVAYRDKGYMPAFQGLCIVDPFGEYIRLAQIFLQRRQTDEALLALDGMVKAFCDAGFSDAAFNGVESLAKIAIASNQNDFAAKIAERLRQYREAARFSK